VTGTSGGSQKVARYQVRLALPEESDEVCEVCVEGFAASSVGILSPATISRQSHAYCNPARVRDEIEGAGKTPAWQRYVVAVTPDGQILGAAGGGVREERSGQVFVLYLRMHSASRST
jgi:hypothetical protein